MLDDESLLADERFIERADALLAALTSIRVSGEVEVSREVEQKASDSARAGLKATVSSRPSVRDSATRLASSSAV